MSIVPSPPANATTTARGLMSAADKTKLDAQSGTNTGDVSLDGASSTWLTLVGQVLKLTLTAAGAAAEGIVTTAAQTFAGVKTFTSAIIASAGVQLSALWNTNGTGSSDVGVKVGVSTADASVNASAKLLSGCTGIGGTEVEKFYFRKAGALVTGGIGFGTTSDLSNVVPGVKTDGNVIGFYNANNAIALYFSLTTGLAGCTGAFAAAGEVRAGYNSGSGVSQGILGADGLLRHAGTDSSGTPGAATINKPTGKSAIANGATTVRITNSLVAAGDQVHITWHGDHGQTRDWVTTGAGFFDVNLNAAASANTAFCWTVSKRI